MMNYCVSPLSLPLSQAASLLRCPAPAKLNLFLHIVGRREDGYHLLQTVFQLIDCYDYLDFFLREDGQIRRLNEVNGVPLDADLTIKAARLLQAYTGSSFGVDIKLDKQLPMGAGMGGGSSDAATTLLALNRLWNLNLSRAQLIPLAAQLGADVPFFVFGENAFAQGIGEQMDPISLPEQWFVILHPQVFVSTATVFSSQALTRDSETVTIADFTAQANPFHFGWNDLEPVVKREYCEIEQALAWLYQKNPQARMTGSGSCVFASFSEERVAQQIAREAQDRWSVYCVRGLSRHPLASFTA